jgi:membrane fusion protein, multidrug efflux system
MGRSVDSMKLSARSELLTFVIGAGLFAAAGAFAWWTMYGGGPAAAQGPARPERAVAISAARAELKNLPFRLDAVGTVQPMVSVAVRSRVDSQVDKVQFADGALVKEGELLFTLDSRSVEAQIRQAEATLARDKALQEKAQRDLDRITGLVEKGTYTQVQLADARTNVESFKATVAQDEATLQNLRVLRTYYDIYAPATGRVGISGVRPGAVIRASDTAAPLATVNQMAPIYVAFGVPERFVGALRAAGDKAKVTAFPQGMRAVTDGEVAFIDNTVDVTTGTIMVRARFGNKDETLWPGTLVGVQLTLRVDDDVVTVPNEAIQSGQKGTFVFVVENSVAKIRPVTVPRSVDGVALVAEGLKAGEIVVTEGQLSLRDGIRVDIKRPAGA